MIAKLELLDSEHLHEMALIILREGKHREDDPPANEYVAYFPMDEAKSQSREIKNPKPEKYEVAEGGYLSIPWTALWDLKPGVIYTRGGIIFSI